MRRSLARNARHERVLPMPGAPPFIIPPASASVAVVLPAPMPAPDPMRDFVLTEARVLLSQTVDTILGLSGSVHACMSFTEADDPARYQHLPQIHLGSRAANEAPSVRDLIRDLDTDGYILLTEPDSAPRRLLIVGGSHYGTFFGV